MLVYVGVLIVGAPVIAFAAWMPLWTNCSLLELPRLRARATGRVVGTESGVEGPVPIVSFDVPGQGSVRFTHDCPYVFKVRQIGDTVRVRYMPQDPCRARIASAWAAATHVLFFAVTVAGLFLLAGAVAPT